MSLKKITKIFIFIFLIFFSSVQAGELISNFDNEGRIRLNDELRKLADSIRFATDDYAPVAATYITQTANGTLSAEQALSSLSTGIMKVTTTTGAITSLGDPLPIANGGTGQSTAQTAIDALLPSQTGNSGKYLTTDATNASWGSISTGQLSNVIFCWFGSDVGTTNVFGLVYGTDLLPNMAAYTVYYYFFGVDNVTYRTILTGKFVKIAGISTVTIHARLWAETTNAADEAVLNVDMGGQSNTVKSVESSTPTWVTVSTINVSSLTNGTTYDITIQLKNESGSGIQSAYCSGVILTGS